jgi:hypothetical protein
VKLKNKVMKHGITLVICGICNLMAAAAQKPSSEARPPLTAPQANPVVVEATSRAQFRALPVNTQVLYKGQKMTKADFMALKTKEWGASKPNVNKRSMKANSEMNLELLKSDYTSKRATELAAQNAKSQADFEAMRQDEARLMQSPQYAALTREASELVNRYATAPAAERARIKQRADDVYKQLVQMEENGASR